MYQKTVQNGGAPSPPLFGTKGIPSQMAVGEAQENVPLAWALVVVLIYRLSYNELFPFIIRISGRYIGTWKSAQRYPNAPSFSFCVQGYASSMTMKIFLEKLLNYWGSGRKMFAHPKPATHISDYRNF